MRGCSRGEHAWLLRGGTCVVAPGAACMVAPGGHAWLLWGGMCGCSGGHVWLLRGGGMHGCSGGACMVARGVHGCSGGYIHGIWWHTEIWSMSGWYASYWNAFLLSSKIWHIYFCSLVQSANLDGIWGATLNIPLNWNTIKVTCDGECVICLRAGKGAASLKSPTHRPRRGRVGSCSGAWNNCIIGVNWCIFGVNK